MLQCYQDYTVWQKAMDLAEIIHMITLRLPIDVKAGIFLTHLAG